MRLLREIMLRCQVIKFREYGEYEVPQILVKHNKENLSRPIHRGQLMGCEL